MFGAADGVVRATWEVLNFLVYGDGDRVGRAREFLESALAAPATLDGPDAKWCAVHLLRLLPELEQASIWSALPPSVPKSVRASLARSEPPVLTLWPPQLSLLQATRDDILSGARRALVSMPTSGGKSLMAQLIVLSHLATGHGDVCYLAPTHSLCREIQQSLRGRVRALRREAVMDIDGQESGW